jgi:hypothetical protein
LNLCDLFGWIDFGGHRDPVGTVDECIHGLRIDMIVMFGRVEVLLRAKKFSNT